MTNEEKEKLIEMIEYSSIYNKPCPQWVYGVIRNMPERKIRKWLNDACSKCGYGVMPWNNTPFCPNCGCKMEVEE